MPSRPDRRLVAVLDRRLVAGLAALLVAIAPVAEAAAQAPPPARELYVLRFGDAVNVQVLIDPPIAIAQDLRPDGRISLPLVGEVEAGGRTVPALTADLQTAFAKYALKPRIVVTVTKFRPNKVTVVGLGVRTPGTFAVPEPVTLIQAIALAGGVNDETVDYGAAVLVTAAGKRHVVDLEALLQGRATSPLLLGDGDVLMVGGSPVAWGRLIPFVSLTINALNLAVNLFRR